MAGKGGSVVNAVWEIAEPIAKSLGVELWDVRFEKEGADYYLRIFIDKDGGVGIDDCVEMSHAIDEPLDKADPIATGYCLEVSSPGAERALTRDEHFMKYLGAKVTVKFIRPVDGARQHKGVLEGYDKGNITFLSSEGKEIVFNKKEASFVKLDDFEDFCK